LYWVSKAFLPPPPPSGAGRRHSFCGSIFLGALSRDFEGEFFDDVILEGTFKDIWESAGEKAL
jgi:hypothetical protein